jgi:hypothetical protein
VTLIQPVTSPQMSDASHTFLKLHQPISEENYPVSPVFNPNTFPYTVLIQRKYFLRPVIIKWVMPVFKRHTKLPPTLRLQALSQRLRQTSYFVCATVFGNGPNNAQNRKILAAATMNLHVTLAWEENPASVPNKSNTYRVHTKQEVSGMWKRRTLGRLLAVASNSKPI